jgi:hypothetical protein
MHDAEIRIPVSAARYWADFRSRWIIPFSYAASMASEMSLEMIKASQHIQLWMPRSSNKEFEFEGRTPNCMGFQIRFAFRLSACVPAIWGASPQSIADPTVPTENLIDV